MADTIEARLESALENIVNISEIGGYLKKDTKESMQEAVSIIRNCFAEMKNASMEINQKKSNTESEVKHVQSLTIQEEEDSCSTRQVLPSLGLQHKATRNYQLSSTPSGEKQNTTDYSMKKIEENITEKVNLQFQETMEKLSQSFQKMIQEEIKSAMKQTGEAEPAESAAEAHPTLQVRDESIWTEIVKRRRGPPPIKTPTFVGTKQALETYSTKIENELQAANRKAWLYIGHLHQNTTPEKVERHLKNLDVKEISECEEIQTKGSLKAFKVGIPLTDLQKITNPESWPEGVIVRRYRFFRTQTQRATLEN